jgi:DNA polymerase/3'-5' exonuclease PolX
MKLARAEKLADKLTHYLIESWEIAAYGGSIRRKRPEVKDIEIIIVLNRDKPKTIELDLRNLEFYNRIKFVKNGEKYKQFWLTKKDGTKIIKVDLFIVTHPAQFGVIYVIRTGCAAFSKWIVNCRKDKGFKFSKGALYRNDTLITTKSELSVFEALQLRFVRPETREETLDFNSLKNEWEEWTED